MPPSIKILKRDPRFARLIKTHGMPGLSRGNPPAGGAFQALVRSIVYQQVSGKAAASILKRFRDLFKGKKFPTPSEVLMTPTRKLRAAGLSAQKASYVKDLAEKFLDGTIKHRSLHNMETADIIEHLTQVKGIGVWTVHMFLIFTLNRPDVLPVGDLGIRKGFQIVYGLKTLPDEKKMEALAKPWRRHASTASWYLWRVADEAKQSR